MDSNRVFWGRWILAIGILVVLASIWALGGILAALLSLGIVLMVIGTVLLKPPVGGA